MAESASTTRKSSKPRTSAKKPAAKKAAASASNTELAKSRFNAALEEAKAGAAALGAEAKERAGAYREQAVVKGDDLAREGKAKASDALTNLGKLASENAGKLDDRFGTRYGDYARSASRGLQETAARLDSKSMEELGEDAREFVRKSPGTAIGLAALAGFLFARLFRGK